MSDTILPQYFIDEEEDDEVAREAVPDLEQELINFRKEWKQELNNVRYNRNERKFKGREDIEEEAARLFLLGSQAERNGAFYEAIALYKRAMHLVPDIESKIDHYPVRTPRERQDSETSLDDHPVHDYDEECLLPMLQDLTLSKKTFCQMELPQRVTHISCLPLELIIYIFRWVVSSDLDTRSLENLSLVCRGFYVCARDEKMWRMACDRAWLGKAPSPRKYGSSWRRMYIERPHALFHGCYISQTSYVRHGEQSLDTFYRPFHMVYYYRMARFFPDGFLMMVCTPQVPQVTVKQMKDRNFRQQGIMSGYYKMHKNKVTAVLKREACTSESYNRYKRRPAQNQQSETESTFFVEFDVESNGHRSHSKLVWSKYFNRVVNKTSGEETLTHFDLSMKSFPPLIFSRVKSYTSVSEKILK